MPVPVNFSYLAYLFSSTLIDLSVSQDHLSKKKNARKENISEAEISRTLNLKLWCNA